MEGKRTRYIESVDAFFVVTGIVSPGTVLYIFTAIATALSQDMYCNLVLNLTAALGILLLVNIVV